MVAIYQTAYPRLKQTFTQKDLNEVYTPTAAELRFALRHCKRGSTSFLGLLVQLKIVQRLGRFVTFGDVPTPIIQHIKLSARNRSSLADLSAYFSSGAKDRHVRLIRQHLKLRPYDTESTNDKVLQWATSAAKTKEALADIINVTLEYLVKEQFELPPFSVLQRLCQSARSQVNNIYYDQLVGYLNAEGRAIINRLLNASGPEQLGWRDLKQEAKRPTPRNIQAYIRYLEWLSSLQSMLPTDLGLPPTKHQQYLNEAKALDLAEMKQLKANKRTALVVVLIRHQYAQTLDSAAEIVIKTLRKMEHTAEKRLEEYRADQQKQIDRLISVLSGTVKVYLDKPESVAAFDPILGKEGKNILALCEQYMAYAGNNYHPFMVPLYKKQRPALFRAVEILKLEAATEDTDVLKAFEFICLHKQRRTETLPIQENPDDPSSKNLLNIRWIRDKWWKVVTGKATKSAQVTHVNKLAFELCVFDRIAEELSTGDLYIPYSETFDDYREQMISWEQYDTELPGYCEELGLVKGGTEFTQALKTQLTEACYAADRNFPDDEQVRIENGKLIIGKTKAEEASPEIEAISELLQDRLEKINLLDLIINAERWLSLHQLFGPLSGFESRVDDPFLRFVLTLFCYGTNIGPTETERSVRGISRKQVAWLNLKRTTVERLDKAIFKVSNAYKKFNLIECWGSGNSVSADGKLWDLYEDNLLSEYHL